MGLLLSALALLPVQWLQMVDVRHGYAVRGNYPGYRLVRTSDGGRTWTDVTPGKGTVHPSGAATIVGRTIVFGTQRGPRTFAVERSDDGGRTWRMSQPFTDPRGLGIGPPDVVDARHLFVAVDQGAAAGSSGESLWASSDGGSTWRFVSRTGFSVTRPGQLPFGCDKNGYGFATPSVGWATAFCAGGRPFVYRTDDGGRTWQKASLPGLRSCQCNVLPPRFFGRRLGVIAVTGTVARLYWTHDGGSTWRATVPPVAGIVGAVATPGWGSAWLMTRTGIVRTVDEGATWQKAPLPFGAGAYRLDAVDGRTAFAFGPSLLETVDGGRHWRGLRTYPACPLQEPDTLHDGSSVLVPPGARSVVLCRYGYELAQSARITGNAVVLLTNELDALPPLSRGIGCPVSLDSVLATFRYRHGARHTVRIDQSGCSAATNGKVLRHATLPVRERLTRILRPTTPLRPCAGTQLGISVRTQGENTSAWIGVTVQNRGGRCTATRVPVTVTVPGSALTMHVSGTLEHGGTQLLVAHWSNWCGSTVAIRVVVEAGSALAEAPVRPLPVCLQHGQPARLSASH